MWSEDGAPARKGRQLSGIHPTPPAFKGMFVLSEVEGSTSTCHPSVTAGLPKPTEHAKRHFKRWMCDNSDLARVCGRCVADLIVQFAAAAV